MVLNIFPFPFLEKCEDLDTNKFATVSSRTPLVSAPRWGPLLRVNVPVLLHGNSGVSALCSSSQWGRKSLGSRILQHGVKQCQNILKVWALANCFSRTGHSILTPSISAASTSESSKSSQSQIDFFFLISLWPLKSNKPTWFYLLAGSLWWLCGSPMVLEVTLL